MGYSLSWQPPPEERERHYIDLKHEIGRFYEEDYNGGNLNVMAGKDLIPFLKGIRAATSSLQLKGDCLELIEAIKKYGEVELTIG